MPWFNAWYFPVQKKARILSKALQQLQPWFGEHAEELWGMMLGNSPKQQGVALATLAPMKRFVVDFANMAVDMGPVMAVFVVRVTVHVEL
jgi:hypothetical protein